MINLKGTGLCQAKKAYPKMQEVENEEH